MTAPELADLVNLLKDKFTREYGRVENAPAEILNVVVLHEIAYQLAVMNENIDMTSIVAQELEDERTQ